MDLTNEHWYIVPAGTPFRVCRGKKAGGTCEARMYSVQSPKTGKWTPVDCSIEGGIEPTDTTDGRGISHFRTCPDARKF